MIRKLNPHYLIISKNMSLIHFLSKWKEMNRDISNWQDIHARTLMFSHQLRYSEALPLRNIRLNFILNRQKWCYKIYKATSIGNFTIYIFFHFDWKWTNCRFFNSIIWSCVDALLSWNVIIYIKYFTPTTHIKFNSLLSVIPVELLRIRIILSTQEIAVQIIRSNINLKHLIILVPVDFNQEFFLIEQIT